MSIETIVSSKDASWFATEFVNPVLKTLSRETSAEGVMLGPFNISRTERSANTYFSLNN